MTKIQKCSQISLDRFKAKTILNKGPFINDVTALGGGGNKAFVTTLLKLYLLFLKSVTRGGRVCQKLSKTA